LKSVVSKVPLEGKH